MARDDERDQGQLVTDEDELLWGDSTIALTDEDGNDAIFEILDTIEYGDDAYLVVSPIEDGMESQDVLVMSWLGDEGDESVLEVADDEVSAAVFDLFRAAHADDYDFDDED